MSGYLQTVPSFFVSDDLVVSVQASIMFLMDGLLADDCIRNGRMEKKPS